MPDINLGLMEEKKKERKNGWLKILPNGKRKVRRQKKKARKSHANQMPTSTRIPAKAVNLPECIMDLSFRFQMQPSGEYFSIKEKIILLGHRGNHSTGHSHQ